MPQDEKPSLEVPPQAIEDPMEVELRAIREAGLRRLRGETTPDELKLKRIAKRIFYSHPPRYAHGDVSTAMPFNPLIRPK
jgi:hypothetical protein